MENEYKIGVFVSGKGFSQGVEIPSWFADLLKTKVSEFELPTKPPKVYLLLAIGNLNVATINTFNTVYEAEEYIRNLINNK